MAFCEQELLKDDLPMTGDGSLALLETELYKRIDTVDRAREEYTMKYTGVSRYDARNYDFVLNVTNIPGYHVAAFLAQNVRMKFMNK